MNFEKDFDCLINVFDGKLLTDQNVVTKFCESVSVKQKVETFIQQCVEHLCHSMNNVNVIIPNVLDAFLCACENEMSNLIEHLSKHILQNIQKYSDDKKFSKVSYQVLKTLLCNDRSGYNIEEDLFQILLHWVHYSYDERKDDFQRLLKMIDANKLSPKYIAYLRNTYECFHLIVQEICETRTLKSTSSNGDIIDERKEAIHVFVRYSKYEDVTRVFYRNNNDEWILKYELQYTADTMKNVAINNQLYRLDYCRNRSPSQIFLTKCSDQLIADYSSYLNPPPVKSQNFDMCGMDNNIYLINFNYSGLHICENKKNLQIKVFSQQELQRGIFNYNCKLDEWFSLPKLKYGLSQGLMSIDDKKLYIVGENCGSHSAQVYDLRVNRWQTLPAPPINDYLDVWANVAGCCFHQGKLYVGYNGGEEKLDVYDPIAGKWDRQQLVESSGHRFSSQKRFKMVSFSKELWVIDFDNGFVDDGSRIDVYYKSEGSRWCLSPSLTEAIKKNSCRNDPSGITIQDAVVI